MFSSKGSFSHFRFSHDTIDSLGYDWSRVGNPAVAPRHPRKTYFPTSTEEIVEAARESRQLGVELTVRGSGHSSNDLVLTDDHLLCTQRLDRILSIGEDAGTVTVQAGVSLVAVDDRLAEGGWGLPVVPDHVHLTAGGLASVGGVSPASHRFGLFVDTVRAVECVGPEGSVATYSREDAPEQLARVLTGRGQHGIISNLTLEMIRVDKQQVLRNERRLIRDVDTFVQRSHEQILAGTGVVSRGFWLDRQLGPLRARLGMVSVYDEVPQTPLVRLRRNASQRWRRAYHDASKHAPAAIAKAVQVGGAMASMFPPPYASIRDVEQAADTTVEFSVGDPSTWFAAWVPEERYPELFHSLYELFCTYRERTGCFTFLGTWVQGIRSTYLGGGEEKRFAAILVVCGVRPAVFTGELATALVERMDDLCIREGALRYMQTRTSTDSRRRALIDPNQLYARDVLAAELRHGNAKNGAALS